jgi:hypothetical protein
MPTSLLAFNVNAVEGARSEIPVEVKFVTVVPLRLTVRFTERACTCEESVTVTGWLDFTVAFADSDAVNADAVCEITLNGRLTPAWLTFRAVTVSSAVPDKVSTFAASVAALTAIGLALELVEL